MPQSTSRAMSSLLFDYAMVMVGGGAGRGLEARSGGGLSFRGRSD